MVISASSNAQWVHPDVVVFVREGVLMGQRVDVDGVRPLAEPFPIANRVEYFFTTSRAMFSVSWTGSVAYHSGQDIGQLVWADQNGDEVGTISGPSDYQPYSARLSPNDSALLVARRRAGLGAFDIWRIDLARPDERSVTSNRGSEVTPVWINHRSILFAGDSPGSVPHLFRKDLITDKVEELLPSGKQQASMAVSSDGRTGFYVERGSGGFRLYELPLARRGKPTPLLLPGSPSVTNMRLSRDERAMTFIAGAGESRMDVYVSALPVTSEPQQVAQNVSGPARWSREESRIYYLRRDGTMVTHAVGTVPTLTVGPPEQLFKLKEAATLQDVSRDGHFLLLVPQKRAGVHPITVLTAAIASTRR